MYGIERRQNKGGSGAWVKPSGLEHGSARGERLESELKTADPLEGAAERGSKAWRGLTGFRAEGSAQNFAKVQPAQLLAI
jgi:hypothetical protein